MFSDELRFLQNSDVVCHLIVALSDIIEIKFACIFKKTSNKADFIAEASAFKQDLLHKIQTMKSVASTEHDKSVVSLIDIDLMNQFLDVSGMYDFVHGSPATVESWIIRVKGILNTTSLDMLDSAVDFSANHAIECCKVWLTNKTIDLNAFPQILAGLAQTSVLEKIIEARNQQN